MKKIYDEPANIYISLNDMNNELTNLKELLILKNITLNEVALNRLDLFTRYLLKWNTVINLTAITKLNEIFIKHYYDCLAPLASINIKQNSSLIDIGTGAGFPGIPIKITRQDLKVTLLDGTQKRVAFLNGAIKELNLSNITAFHSRAEEASHTTLHREKYDYATARAVAPLNILCEYCLPFVKQGGSFIAFKGINANEEIEASKNAIKLLGGEILSLIELSLPFDEGKRQVIVIIKTSQTPTQFPRKSQIITSKPL